MNQRRITIFAIMILTCNFLIAAGRGRKEWRLEGKTLKLHDEAGREKKRLDLYERRDRERIKARTTGEMVEIQVDKISRAYPSKDGRYVAHAVQEVRNYGYEYAEATTTIKYLDSDGKIRWEKRAVDLDRKVHVSDNGLYISLVVTTRDGCGSGNDCKRTGLILDSQGREIMRFGPSYGVVTIEPSENGRYGMVTDAAEDTIFYDVEKKITTTRKWKDFKGLPRVRNDGVVEIVRRQYEGTPPYRTLVKEEVVETFEIK